MATALARLYALGAGAQRQYHFRYRLILSKEALTKLCPAFTLLTELTKYYLLWEGKRLYATLALLESSGSYLLRISTLSITPL